MVDEDVQILLEAKYKFRPSRVNVIIVGDARTFRTRNPPQVMATNIWCMWMRARVLLSEEVGKSQLFCRYVRRDEAPASYSPTIGVDYANKSIMTPGAAPLALQIWVIMHAQRRFADKTS